MLSVVIFILILAVLVLAHEWGHFISARRAGVKVEEFGFGFPPRIVSFQKGETRYSINWIPLGGFVKIFGEEGSPPQILETKTWKGKNAPFYAKPVGVRAKIIAAGVLMNVLLAAVLLSLGHLVGLPTIIDESIAGRARDISIQITGVAPASPAEEAGLKIGDAIQSIKAGNVTQPIDEIDELQQFTREHAGKEVVLTIKRGEDLREVTVTPRSVPPAGQGPIGVALAKVGIVSFGFPRAIWEGIRSTVALVGAMLTAFWLLLKNLITAGQVPADVAGPVGIAVLTSQISQLGLRYLIQFVAILSVNLALLNILPFPALDGGRLLFLAIEKFKGSPVSQKTEKLAHSMGFAFLIALMILVTFRDIGRLF